MEINEIDAFLKSKFNASYRLELIEGSASDRKNFKVILENNKFILTQGVNIKENKTFIAFANFFSEKGINIPKVISTNKKGDIYLQEYVGDKSLLDYLFKEGESKFVKILYKESINQLISIQTKGKVGVEKDWCYDFSEFNALTTLHDLFYFKNHFLDLLNIPYTRKNLIEDFSSFAKKLEKSKPKTFIHRDFQARNIMVNNKEPYIIDFQGGMMGPPVYDLVSLIWQSRANLSKEFKEEIKAYYFNQFNLISKEKFSINDFELQYQLCLIIRQLQTLGAYGFRGIYQKKPQFAISILQSTKNLEALLKLSVMKEFLYLKEIITQINSLTELQINNIINAK
ncbi:MAG: aminoglycoside phosphotransferase family protein [Solirubrobacteraceae bacterium]